GGDGGRALDSLLGHALFTPRAEDPVAGVIEIAVVIRERRQKRASEVRERRPLAKVAVTIEAVGIGAAVTDAAAVAVVFIARHRADRARVLRRDGQRTIGIRVELVRCPARENRLAGKPALSIPITGEINEAGARV